MKITLELLDEVTRIDITDKCRSCNKKAYKNYLFSTRLTKQVVSYCKKCGNRGKGNFIFYSYTELSEQDTFYLKCK